MKTYSRYLHQSQATVEQTLIMSVCDKLNTAVLAGSALAQGQLDRAYDLLSEGDSLHFQKGVEILVNSGQCEAMKFLINECKLDVDKHNLLHLALLAGHEDLAKLLVVSGADVNKCSQEDEESIFKITRQKMQTWAHCWLEGEEEAIEHEELQEHKELRKSPHLPLHLSVNCSVDIMHFLLQSGADVNKNCGRRCWHRETALLRALITGNVEKIKLLINHGADIEAKISKNGTALTYACDNSFMTADCLQVLLENGANPNSMSDNRLTKRDGITCRISSRPIHRATEWGDIQKLQLLLQHGAQLEARTSDGHTALTLACKFSVPADCVRILLENGAFPSVKTYHQQTPLSLAGDKNDEEKISLLKQFGASEEERTDQGDTALMSACQRTGDVESVRHLLENNASPNLKNEEGETALHYAANAGDIQKLQMLVEHNSDVNVMNDTGVTPLMKACKKVSVSAECVQLLLENRALPNLTDIKGKTAVHHAAKKLEIHKLKMLVRYGANVNATDIANRTPLIKLCFRTDNAKCARFLLQNKACPNLSDKNRYTPLHRAACSGNKEMMKLLVQYQADVNAVTNSRETPLMLAFLNHQTDCVRFLLQKRALPNLTDHSGSTALHLAAERGDRQMMDLLVQYQGDVNARSENGKTPLMLALTNDRTDCVQFLLQNNALANLTDNNGSTALHLAAERGDRQMVDLLVQYQADVNAMTENGETPLMLVCKLGESDCVRFLLHHNALLNLTNKRGWTALHLAAQTGHTEIVDLLIQLQANVNAITEFGETPLLLACKCGQMQCSRILLQNNVLPNLTDKSRNTALHFALERNNREIVDLLIQLQADVNAMTESGETPLMLACKRGQIEFARILLQNNALPNLTGYNGSTALHLAAERGDRQMMDLLVQYQADVNARSENGETPLMMACKHGQIECATTLLQNNALPNLTDNNGSTALHLAAERDDKKMADLLVEYHADVNARSENGETPLMLACAKGSVTKGFVNFLLEKGALVNLTTKENKTALHYAADKGAMKTIQQLIKRGAHVEVNSLFFPAARSKNPKLLELLKKHGADLSSVDSTGQNAIMLAASSPAVSSSISALQWLVDKGVSVNQKDNNGWTPLMAAVHRRAFKVAKFLLGTGADIHAARLEGNTETTVVDDLFGNRFNSDCVEHLIRNGIVNSLPSKYNALLHKMIQIDERKIIVLLLTHGMGPTLCRVPLYHCFYPSVPSLSNVSPLTVALRSGNFPVVQYLIGNMVLCPCDLNDRLYHSELRTILYLQGNYDIVDIMDEFYTHPKSLFQLSFITVSHIIGGAPGRLDRINTLLLPQLLKDSLLFKTGDVPMDFTSKLPFKIHPRYRGWIITE